MKTNWKALLGTFILLALVPASLMAQNYVYTNNDLLGGNTVSAYLWDTTQTPPLVPIGTYSTGGTGTGPGGLYSADRIIVVTTSANKTFVYASNAGSNDIGVFALNQSTGDLTYLFTTALPTGSSNGSESGISLAATPDGSYLYAGSTLYGGQIAIYQIDSTTGALTNPALKAADGPVTSMKVSPLGDLLVVAIKDNYEIQTFPIGSTGALASGSAVIQFGTVFTGEDVNCAETRLYAGIAGPNVKVFSITAGTGALAYLSASTAVGSIVSNQVVRLSPDDKTLYASNQGSHSVTISTVAF
jgi:WD40 repeat protein